MASRSPWSSMAIRCRPPGLPSPVRSTAGRNPRSSTTPSRTAGSIRPLGSRRPGIVAARRSASVAIIVPRPASSPEGNPDSRGGRSKTVMTPLLGAPRVARGADITTRLEATTTDWPARSSRSGCGRRSTATSRWGVSDSYRNTPPARSMGSSSFGGGGASRPGDPTSIRSPTAIEVPKRSPVAD